MSQPLQEIYKPIKGGRLDGPLDGVASGNRTLPTRYEFVGTPAPPISAVRGRSIRLTFQSTNSRLTPASRSITV
jgi:hypothetical protein